MNARKSRVGKELVSAIVLIGYVASRRNGNTLVVEWAGCAALQSSTNVNGP